MKKGITKLTIDPFGVEVRYHLIDKLGMIQSEKGENQIIAKEYVRHYKLSKRQTKQINKYFQKIMRKYEYESKRNV